MPRQGENQTEFDASAEGEGGNLIARVDLKVLKKLLAVGIIPGRIKSAHEADQFPDFAPRLIIHVRAGVGDLPFHGHFVAAMVQTEDGDGAGVGVAHAHDEIQCGGFAGGVGANQTVNGASRHGQIKRPELETAEIFFQAANFNGVCVHKFFLLLMRRNRSAISFSTKPASRASRMATRSNSPARSVFNWRLRSSPLRATKVPRPWRRRMMPSRSSSS